MRLDHFKSNDIKNLMEEYERLDEFLDKIQDDKYRERKGNKISRIDVNKTNLNYRLGNDKSLKENLDKRLGEVKYKKTKDLIVVSTWIVTLPEELKSSSEAEQRLFFETAYEKLKLDYGDKNVINGYVHMDETTPHMHVPIVPVTEVECSRTKTIKSKSPNRANKKVKTTFTEERVSAKALFHNHGYEFKRCQREMDYVMEKTFGKKKLILNGRTAGNYTAAEMREREAQQKQLEEQAKAVLKGKLDNKRKEDELNSLIARYKALNDNLDDVVSNRVQKALERRESANTSLQEQSSNRPHRRLPGEPQF